MSEASPSPVSCRAGTAADAASIAEFIESFVAGGKLLRRTLQELNELLPNGFVAEADGQIVGFAALEIYSPKLAEIRSLAVSEEFRRFGVGRDLVARCVELAQENNVLEVMAVTSTDAFFRSCGFDYTLPGERKALFIQTRDSSDQNGSTQ